ncbi:MogA/MoaB family molybdenum cofactor biosynthesis protein [Halorussus caseinilyticus]|uniref:MogA/MoaB family molybdenum cofactor biosynthesis protein n=1 Tax=Halorussus caseinilyticus TaxID=3034025 RepID=UPI0023E79CD5|nr:molybdenum cofactor synthesis domain-containing protein [Halorussus sp. DT72]
MVDFQSRDTRRGRDDEDDEDDRDSPPSDSDDGGGHDDSTGHDGSDDHQHADHGHHAHDVDSLGAAVVTVSSSRSLSEDPAGDAIVAGLEDAGHKVVSRDLIDDSYDGVQGSIDALVGRGDVDVVVTTGGTGVTPDDVTIEAVEPLFDKELPGFGELFRLLSHDEIGTRVVGTRATAGVVDGVVVFCLPGSENAARLGVEQIIVEEAGHLAGLASREE